MSDEAQDVYFPDSKTILGSDDFRTYPMAQKYRLLQQSTGIDFSSTISFLEKLPVFVDGMSHKVLRRALASLLAGAKAEQVSAMEETLARLMAEHLTRNGSFDLVADFSMPLWRALSRCLTRQDAETYALIDELTALAFFPTLSIRRRKKIDDRLTALLTDADEKEVLRIVLITLGFRPFTGSLSLSLYQLVQKFEAIPLAQYEFPDDYPASSIPFTERIANGHTNIGGRDIARDQRFRCFIHHEKHGTSANREGLYGYGKHVCLGRPISQMVIRKLAELARQYDCRLAPKRLELMRHTEPFCLPQIAEVDVAV